MIEPKFKNKPSDHIRYSFTSPSTGVKIDHEYFVSRAPAVVGVIFALRPGGIEVLITKRSNKMRDEAGKFCVPCGYLDWDETGYEGMTREVYEETSLYLPDYEKYKKFDNNKQPFWVKTDPKDNRQNVSLLYLTYFDFSSFDVLKFPYFVEKFSCKETELNKWMFVKEFFDVRHTMEWAFEHDRTIEYALNFLTDKVKFKK
jgi:8-oxo-dGTP pyrophosphatase MutT (NUDIX family)